MSFLRGCANRPFATSLEARAVGIGYFDAVGSRRNGRNRRFYSIDQIRQVRFEQEFTNVG